MDTKGTCQNVRIIVVSVSIKRAVNQLNGHGRMFYVFIDTKRCFNCTIWVTNLNYENLRVIYNTLGLKFIS